jgi:hypothetical protein
MIGNESTRDLFPKKPLPLPRSAILHLWTAAAWNDENALSWIEALRHLAARRQSLLGYSILAKDRLCAIVA